MVSFCFREVSELLSAHRLVHSFRTPPKGRFTTITDGQASAKSHLLFIGFGSSLNRRSSQAFSFRR